MLYGATAEFRALHIRQRAVQPGPVARRAAEVALFHWQVSMSRPQRPVVRFIVSVFLAGLRVLVVALRAATACNLAETERAIERCIAKESAAIEAELDRTYARYLASLTDENGSPFSKKPSEHGNLIESATATLHTVGTGSRDHGCDRVCGL
ncbi:MAG: hypothetical protein KatS3mg077_2907 [Candidatus Binatia bacterium]|nr:MAG: hypothetical protein KatS3mg077_2907 [Candidatus Binatia bacterium]